MSFKMEVTRSSVVFQSAELETTNHAVVRIKKVTDALQPCVELSTLDFIWNVDGLREFVDALTQVADILEAE